MFVKCFLAMAQGCILRKVMSPRLLSIVSGRASVFEHCYSRCKNAAKYSSHELSKASYRSVHISASPLLSSGIQKDISPLSTKRVVRKKKQSDNEPKDQVVYALAAYASAEEYDLESIKKSLEKQGVYSSIGMLQDVADTLHFQAKYKVDNEDRDIFFFREGSVVFWNMPKTEREQVLELLRPHQRDSYDRQLIQEEFETLDFIYTDSETRLVGDEIRLLKPPLVDLTEHHLEKYAFSNALSISVKLAIWEASLQRYVESIENVLEDLKEGRKIRISRPEVLQKTGELFNLRHLINLSSDLLDTPDFYWDRERLGDFYNRTCIYLSIPRRTKVMNDKLTYCVELTDLLRSHLNDNHHTRLEWMIIALITVEVIFEVIHLLQG